MLLVLDQILTWINLGGEDDTESYLTDILAFEAENLKWKKIGNMKYGRSKHSITTLSSAQVVCG